MSCCNAAKTLDEVKNTNIVSLYDANDENGAQWEDKYKNRIITITKSGVTFNATIMHTCGDESSHNSCSLWANGGVLILLEY